MLSSRPSPVDKCVWTNLLLLQMSMNMQKINLIPQFIYYWDITDLLFWSPMDIPNLPRPQSPDVYKSTCCFYECLTTYTKSTWNLLSFWRYFEHGQPRQIIPTWYLLLLEIPCHIQKINLIPITILEILLTYHFEVLWACTTMSDHNHLIFVSQCAASMNAYQHAIRTSSVKCGTYLAEYFQTWHH